MRRTAFSTGFEFKYKGKYHEHDYYKDLPFVEAKYKNLKEEIIESGYLSHSKWMEFIDLKGRKYWNKSETIKKINDINCLWNTSLRSYYIVISPNYALCFRERFGERMVLRLWSR